MAKKKFDLIMPFGPFAGDEIEDVPCWYLLLVYEKVECWGRLRVYLNENIKTIRKNAKKGL